MASDTDTARPERGAKPRGRRASRYRWLPGSRLGRLIVALNVLGLAILIAGALVLNEFRRGLVEARKDSLTTQGELMATIIDRAATVGEPQPMMDPTYAGDLLQMLANPKTQRARLFDAQGRVVADSEWVADRVEWKVLPPARARDDNGGLNLDLTMRKPLRPRKPTTDKGLSAEVAYALRGGHWAGMRRGEDNERVVSVSIPIQHVQAVLGVLTLEANDVDAIIARERLALIPFILIAILVTLSSSLLLTRLIAQPVLRLARAADRVRLAGARAISLPDLAKRDDELGDLTRSLEAMTDSLSERMDAIESFAADVAHEIKNPLTSLRSAIEMAARPALAPDRRAKLMTIVVEDIERLNRLISDISDASRLDAELMRGEVKTVDLKVLLSDMVQHYAAISAQKAGVEVELRLSANPPYDAHGHDGRYGQVFR
ncbi:MAG: sensor N-terminal transmembrane domain-containing protein, partial [Phenylobacterium sp.]